MSVSVSRLESLLAALERFYGALPAPPHDPFALFVWEVLSVHSTPKKRDAAFSALKRSRALTPDAMWRAPRKKLESSVTLAGPYVEQRLRALRTGVDQFRRSPDLSRAITGPLPGARRALKGLPQMGEGGAYRMLLFAGDRPVLPVDARVSRVARRLETAAWVDLHEDRPLGAREPGARVAGDGGVVPAGVSLPVATRLGDLRRGQPSLPDLSAQRRVP
jgi:endonuclease III